MITLRHDIGPRHAMHVIDFAGGCEGKALTLAHTLAARYNSLQCALEAQVTYHPNHPRLVRVEVWSDGTFASHWAEWITRQMQRQLRAAHKQTRALWATRAAA